MWQLSGEIRLHPKQVLRELAELRFGSRLLGGAKVLLFGLWAGARVWADVQRGQQGGSVVGNSQWG